MDTANTIRIGLAAAFLVAGVAIGQSARAADPDVQTIVVPYADLNLAKKAGVDALRHRLLVASRIVCGESSDEVDLSSDFETCYIAARHDALRGLRVAVAAANRSSYAVASAAPN